MRKEIADETDRETGRTKQISTVPIYLSIYSPNGKTTTLAMCWLSLYYLAEFILFAIIALPHLHSSALVLRGLGCGLF